MASAACSAPWTGLHTLADCFQTPPHGSEPPFELHYSRQAAKKRLHSCCLSLPADTNDLVLQVCVCVCLCVFAFETKKSTLRISLNVSSCEHPSLPLRNVTDGTKRIWEDTE